MRGRPPRGSLSRDSEICLGVRVVANVLGSERVGSLSYTLGYFPEALKAGSPGLRQSARRDRGSGRLRIGPGKYLGVAQYYALRPSSTNRCFRLDLKRGAPGTTRSCGPFPTGK